MIKIPLSTSKILFYLMLFSCGLAIIVLILNLIPKLMLSIIKGLINLIFRKKQKLVLPPIIPIDITKQLVSPIDITKQLVSPIDITKMSGTEFEKFITKIFNLIGYKTTDIQPTRDGGVDIIAKMNNEISFIQCKRYQEKTKISRTELDKFLGTMTDKKIKKGFFITTSDFTKEAKEFAMRNNIKLIDKKSFDKLEQFLELLKY